MVSCQEPDELRGSSPVLRGPRGEVPRGYSATSRPTSYTHNQNVTEPAEQGLKLRSRPGHPAAPDKKIAPRDVSIYLGASLMLISLP